jgi:hypothetical protein
MLHFGLGCIKYVYVEKYNTHKKGSLLKTKVNPKNALTYYTKNKIKSINGNQRKKNRRCMLILDLESRLFVTSNFPRLYK